MNSWSDLLQTIEALPAPDRGAALNKQMDSALDTISKLRGDRNVILYGSAYLQKPDAPPASIQITHEDLNGFMSSVFGMDWPRGLTLILHTPGGVTNAAETIVDYLRSKFESFEVIVPAYAMSAGTMITLAADKIIMGRQSQLGPIDSQLPLGGRYVSAGAIVDQFGRARDEIEKDEGAARLWYPLLQALGASGLVEATNALEYGERMVAEWLAQGMFSGIADPKNKGAVVAKHFSSTTTHKSHGRRINRDEARSQDLNVEDLEDSQELQDAVLTAYHAMTIIFEKGPAAKLMWSTTGRQWVKNLGNPVS